jgi:enoyl-CoA hydratase
VADPVEVELRDEIALLRIDDGKANALSPGLIDAVEAALDRVEKDARAVVIVGRPGRFSAGFDLSVMRQSQEAVAGLVASGARLALRLYEFPCPVVMACSGHAMAMGAILLLAGDERLGAEGAFKIALNEVAIGMTLPMFAIEFGRERLSKRHVNRALALAETYDPAGAVDAGFLDRLVPAERLEDEALAEAGRLAQLPASAHRSTKRAMRSAMVERVRGSLDADMERLTGPSA